MEPRLRGAIVEGSFKVTQERTRWLRVAFRHLGRRDTVVLARIDAALAGPQG
ncbi:MAG: hypothetical protein MUF64_30755 [Polyangiaceae bacterium]|jgi:hypothetical protein|nr:hypothetical protein [Polyangiaceae bacterium]